MQPGLEALPHPDPSAGLRAPSIHIPFDNTYVRLPPRFYARLDPTPVAEPRLVKLNRTLAESLRLDPDALSSKEGAEILVGNRVPAGADPAALAYAGHQFGHFSPQLGDGRAILLGEVVGRNGARQDIQLKGSGPTPFSRQGDGRAALGPVLREYLIGEAMHAFGIPTSRALAAVTTGQPVYRERALPGAVLTRVASSHIRVGTFQYFAARQDVDAVRLLADYTIARHYPEAAGDDRPYRAFLNGTIARQADLIAQWLLVGFIHGVMNTDNMAVSGETIDYGPCAFMDAYDPATVFSSIDHQGRYAYGNQPAIAHWNLTRLAEALLPVLAEDQETAIAVAKEALAGFGPRFEAAYLGGLRRKAGLSTEQEGDTRLIEDLLKCMAQAKADFTLTFRHLCDAAADWNAVEPVRALFANAAVFDAWAERWYNRLEQEPGARESRRASMRAINPAVIPRNHNVEAALEAAVQSGDFQPFEELLEAIAHPFQERPGYEAYMEAPGPSERVYQTFCGT